MLDWYRILRQLGVRPATVDTWAPVFGIEIPTPDRFSLGAAEIDDFLGQVMHESGMLERIEENLSYSAERLMAVWPTRFPTIASARPFARNPEALANHVYAGRLGNTEPGDGWRYRGRGLIQITGRSNYAALGRLMSIDLAGDPDKLLQHRWALRASVVWWESNVPDRIMGDIAAVSRRVNGGTVGLEHRRQVSDAADMADGVRDGRLA